MTLDDYKDFISHIMSGFTGTQEGLDNLLDKGEISKDLWIEYTRSNYSRYKERSEKFAKDKWGDNWKENLTQLNTFRQEKFSINLILSRMKQFLKTSFLLAVSLILFASCTKGNFDAFFSQLGKEIPLEKVSYKVAKPEIDTTIIWYAPYKIFENRTKFVEDSIFHSEEFNWQGLGDFLWEKYQERKARKNKEKEESRTETSSLNQSDQLNTEVMVNEIYLSLGDLIKACESTRIEHVDIWNRQPDNENIETAYNKPAAFISFDEIEPESSPFGKKSANIKLSVWLEQEYYEDTHIGASRRNENLTILSNLDNLSDYIETLEPDGCSRLDLRGIYLDENFSNKVVYRLEFLTRYSACPVPIIS